MKMTMAREPRSLSWLMVRGRVVGDDGIWRVEIDGVVAMTKPTVMPVMRKERLGEGTLLGGTVRRMKVSLPVVLSKCSCQC